MFKAALALFMTTMHEHKRRRAPQEAKDKQQLEAFCERKQAKIAVQNLACAIASACRSKIAQNFAPNRRSQQQRHSFRNYRDAACCGCAAKVVASAAGNNIDCQQPLAASARAVRVAANFESDERCFVRAPPPPGPRSSISRCRRQCALLQATAAVDFAILSASCGCMARSEKKKAPTVEFGGRARARKTVVRTLAAKRSGSETNVRRRRVRFACSARLTRGVRCSACGGGGGPRARSARWDFILC